jgi:tRNA nucleotidyltransferase (CCA-adding enzyme)
MTASTKPLSSAVITLNEVEATLRTLLLDVAEYIKQNDKTPLVLRFTGGWTRDKLLGVPSNDIDVAINKMTGYQFGLRMKDYLDIPGNADKYGLGGSSKKAGSLSKIAANPEQSKHLETVTTRILGLDLDLVNLRKETYTEDSRNPQMEFGTPEEDALRRDATINAMFYNITTSTIEDFTGRGYDDLQNHIIRTPLEPYTTFKDDPLRVLRLIRFSSRLNYQIDPEARKAMGKKEISTALKLKITRERVWTEVEKMLKGPDPQAALTTIDELDLYRTVFVDPAQESIYTPDTDNWAATYTAVGKIISSKADPQSDQLSFVHSILILNDEEKFMSWIMAAMIPWADAPEPEPLKTGKIPLPMVTSMAIAALKAPNKVTDLLTPCVRNLKEIRELKDKGEKSREVLGMAIRRWGASWRQQVMFALLYEIFTSPSSEKGKYSNLSVQTIKTNSPKAIIDSYSTFLTRISDLKLLTAHTLKPLIDGTRLAKALSTPPGPWMRTALDVVMAWQLRNPDIVDPLAAVEEVKASGVLTSTSTSPEHERAQGPAQKKQKKGELTSALVTHFLRLTIRPLFSKAPAHPEITPAGRKKAGEPISRRFGSEPYLNDEEIKPWKVKDVWALDLLQWVCRSLDDELVEREWGYLIPPVLTVLGDTDVKIRAKGCDFLRFLLLATSSSLLKRTGLAPLFEENLYVSTSYLPTLTPEKDSVLILNTALPALLTLTNSIHPPAQNPTFDATAHSLRTKSLDKILRKGILFPISHAGEYIHVSEAVLTHLPAVLNAMGIDSVKHLKDTVPLLSTILAEPLGAAYPPMLLTATKGMQAVILNGWPRIGRWRSEVLRGLTVCWVRIVEEDIEVGGGLDGVKRELKDAVSMLKAAVQHDGDEGVDWEGETRELVGAHAQLEQLFD